MDSQKYLRLEQNTAGGVKTQTEADGRWHLRRMYNQYADMFIHIMEQKEILQQCVH